MPGTFPHFISSDPWGIPVGHMGSRGPEGQSLFFFLPRFIQPGNGRAEIHSNTGPLWFLCTLAQVSWPLWAPVSPSVQRGCSWNCLVGVIWKNYIYLFLAASSLSYNARTSLSLWLLGLLAHTACGIPVKAGAYAPTLRGQSLNNKHFISLSCVLHCVSLCVKLI